jgi:hypothetical protein
VYLVSILKVNLLVVVVGETEDVAEAELLDEDVGVDNEGDLSGLLLF